MSRGGGQKWVLRFLVSFVDLWEDPDAKPESPGRRRVHLGSNAFKRGGLGVECVVNQCAGSQPKGLGTYMDIKHEHVTAEIPPVLVAIDQVLSHSSTSPLGYLGFALPED